MTRATLAELWFDLAIDGWPLAMSVLIGIGCALLGCVLLVRRAALLGDAISHSVLPGIAAGLIVAALFPGAGEERAFGSSRSMVFVVIGALVAGLASAALIESFHRHSRIKSDTALAAVFPAFFAVGVIVLDLFARGAHFDSQCVFYGSLEVIRGFDQVAPTLIATVCVAGFVVLAYHDVLVASFDPSFARSLGLRIRLVDNALVALLTAMVVCAFEAVGAVLVVSFLVVPPATAYLLTDRFHRMLSISAAVGVLAAVLGCWLTIVLGGGARAPTIAIAAGGLFALAFLFAPHRGAVARLRRALELERRILDENFLAAVQRLSSKDAPGAGHGVVAEAGGAAKVDLDVAADLLGYAAVTLRPALRRAVRRAEAVAHGDGTVSLTARGRERIEAILHGRRLWEQWMMSEMGTAPDHVQDAADQIEHYLQPALLEDLDAELDEPRTDT